MRVQTNMGAFGCSGSLCFSCRVLQFSYDKAHETTVLFHVKDKHSGKKIDSLFNGTFHSFYKEHLNWTFGYFCGVNDT